MTDMQKKQIKTLRLQGIGYVKIGEMLGISDNTVRSFSCYIADRFGKERGCCD